MEITEELIRQLVVEVVEKIERMRVESKLSRKSSATESFRGRLLSGAEVEYFFRSKVDLVRVPKATIITPLASERARDLGVTLERV